MNNLLISPKTKKKFDLFTKKPSQALLIAGPSGSGKSILAKVISSDLLGLDSLNALEIYPYFFHIKKPDDKHNISIDQIRGLIKQIKLKIPGQNSIRRVIFIESAGDLNQESSNAILKILEEPSSETLYILSCNSTDSLLPTIVSRCQTISVSSISQKMAHEYVKDGSSEDQIDTAWRLSNGRAGLMLSLLDKDIEHPLKAGIVNAKDFLRKNTYARLLSVDKLIKDKEDLDNFFDGLGRVLAALQIPAINKQDQSQAKKLLNSRRLVEESQKALGNSGSARLILLRLSINLIR